MWPANFSKRTCICSLICLALLAGCATPQGKFHSRKDPAYSGKLGRVLIIYHNEEDAVSQVGRKFADAFLTRFTALLGQKDVVTEIVRPQKEELDQNTFVRSAAARFHPRQALHFGLSKAYNRSDWARVGYTQFTHETSMIFAFSLIDVPHERTVWRGELGYFVIPDAKAVADQFVARLVTEGFLDGP